VKRLEVYGLIVMFLVITVTYQLFIIPSERKESLRPIFNAVSSQRTNGPIYLVNPSETIRGASFFYLGKRIPALYLHDLSPGRFENRPGTTLLIESYGTVCDDNQILSNLRSKGYRPLFQKKFNKHEVVYVYSNGS
jgi:hypothetical protein